MKRIAKTISTLVLVIGLFAGVLLVQSVVSFRGKAAGQPANLTVDVSKTYNDALNSWQFLSQGGEEKGNSLHAVVPFVQKLHPQYIRVDHVFDFFSVVSSTNGENLTLNWTNLDAYLADIRAVGAKPFIALSYTPHEFNQKDTDMPNPALWNKLVKATIEHISGKNGLGIADVYYEVWNEPDLFGAYKTYPPKDYRDLYVATSNAALSATNVLPFKLGGPATTSLYQNWFDALVALQKDRSVKFDFFSWHEYGEDTGVLEQNIAKTILWKAQSGLPNLELFVTENGIDAANNPAYDDTLAAYHTLSSVARSADKINGLMSFEIKDGPGPTQKWGRWGLLTHEKFGAPLIKPRFSALEFLNQMASGARLAVSGGGTYVSAFARQTNGVSRIMVVNYDPEAKHVEAVPMTFTGISATKFLFVRQDFLGNTTKILVVPTNGTWNTVQYFKANSASIFEIIPQ